MKAKTARREFDIEDPETYGDYDAFLDGSIDINGVTYTGGAAVEALRRASGQGAVDRAADERSAANARKIAEAEATNAPWLEAWQRASADLERRKREAMAELTAAVRNDPVGSAFIQVLALTRALDHGRRIASQKDRENRGAGPLPDTGFSHPATFDETLNTILREAASETKGLLQNAIERAKDADK